MTPRNPYFAFALTILFVAVAAVNSVSAETLTLVCQGDGIGPYTYTIDLAGKRVSSEAAHYKRYMVAAEITDSAIFWTAPIKPPVAFRIDRTSGQIVARPAGVPDWVSQGICARSQRQF